MALTHHHHQLLRLASIDRTNISDTSSDFWLEAASPIPAGSKWALHTALLPASFFNVSAVNNVLPFTDTGARTATITPGFYSNSTFATAVAAAMNAVGSQTYTVTISSTTQQMTISAAAAFQLQFSLSPTTNAAALMGFAVGTDTASATSLTGTNIVNVQPVLSFGISIDNDHGIVAFPASGASATFVVPLSVNVDPTSLGWVLYTPPASAQQVWTVSQNKKRMHVRVLDNVGNPLNLLGVEWYALLRRC